MTWLFLIFIFGGLSFLAFTKRLSVKQLKIITFLALILFAFLYKPSPEADIYRYKEALLYMQERGPDAAYSELWYIYENSQAFFGIMVLLSYLPSSLFFPVTLLCTYGIALAIFFDIVGSLNLSKYQFAMAFSFFLCCVNFGIVFSIVRFYMAYLIGLSGIYMWFRKNAGIGRRLLSAAMILGAIFIHTAGFLITLIWLLTLLYHIKPIRILAVFIPFSMLFADRIVSWTGGIFGGSSLYNVIVEKFFDYSADNYESMLSRSRIFYYQLLAFIVIVFLAIKLMKCEDNRYVSFNAIYTLFLLFTIAFIPNVTLFIRTLQILLVLTPMYLAVNKGLWTKSPILQLGMVGECGLMLLFYGRLSTYYYL